MIVSAIQITSSPSFDRNMETASILAGEAAKAGASLITLPEYFSYYGPEETWADMSRHGEAVIEDMRRLAGGLGVYILAGSVLLPSTVSGKSANVSVLIGPGGEEVVRYQKIRLFDAGTPVRNYRESDWLAPGDRLAVGRVGQWTLGLSICFELRFPDHFASLRRMGADVIAAPSAFTYETGRDHWMTLLSARAIETQCYIVAPALVGGEDPNRRCFGGTAIIDPWGRVLAAREEGDGFVTAGMDRNLVTQIRRAMPLGFDAM